MLSLVPLPHFERGPCQRSGRCRCGHGGLAESASSLFDLDGGAQAVHADHAVRNPFSWRTRLMTIALGSFDALRSLALGLSCGLRGNGMCFSSSLLEEVPHDAASLVEDRSP